MQKKVIALAVAGLVSRRFLRKPTSPFMVLLMLVTFVSSGERVVPTPKRQLHRY